MGAAFVYYLIFPLAFTFFLSYQAEPSDAQMGLSLLPSVGQYLSLVMHLIFAFGLAFELPVLLLLLVRAGLLSARTLAAKRRWAIVIIVAVAAVITPPDAISQIALSIPLYLLYEISIHLGKIIERRREERERAFEESLRSEAGTPAARAAEDDRDTLGLDETDFNYSR
jgi:sec-independent protein translocase protein TatC